MAEAPITNGSDARTHVNYRAWFLHVVFWDGVLPISTSTVPLIVHWLFPDGDAIVVVAVVLPIVAFLIRMNVGGHRITYNRCGPLTQLMQFVVFGIAALLLICVDSLLAIAVSMPGAVWPKGPELVFWICLIVGYLLAMTFAMYPGRTTVVHQTAEQLG